MTTGTRYIGATTYWVADEVTGACDFTSSSHQQTTLIAQGEVPNVVLGYRLDYTFADCQLESIVAVERAACRGTGQ